MHCDRHVCLQKHTVSSQVVRKSDGAIRCCRRQHQPGKILQILRLQIKAAGIVQLPSFSTPRILLSCVVSFPSILQAPEPRHQGQTISSPVSYVTPTLVLFPITDSELTTCVWEVACVFRLVALTLPGLTKGTSRFSLWRVLGYRGRFD